MLKAEELDLGIDPSLLDDTPTPSSNVTTKSKKDLLQELRFKQNACRKRNHAQVVEEDRRINTPVNRNTNAPPRDTIGSDTKKNEDGEEEENYLLNTTAEQAEERDKRKNRKKKGTFGWEMFNEQAHHNSYKRRMKDLEGNKDYKQAPPPPSISGEASSAVGPLPDEALYGSSAKPSKEGLDRMVAELSKAEDRRAKFSRRRETNPSADINYINERNKIFNKKIARAFDQYTVEIRQNLERGTAL